MQHPPPARRREAKPDAPASPPRRPDPEPALAATRTDDLTPSPETRHGNSAVVSAEIPISADDYPLTALVDTGADFSVMSSQLAGRLRKVVTPWTGPAIRSAGGHLLTPIGVCTARIKIRDAYFPACFLVLRECSKPLILGLDFLYEYGAIIDLRELLVTLSTNRAVKTEAQPRCMALRLCDGHVTLPPGASVFVTVKCDSDFTC